MSPDGLEADPAKLDKIINWPAPNSKKQVQTFMGFVNWIRKFIPEISTNALILNRLTTKTARFHWTQTQQEAFDNIKNTIKNVQPLKNIDYESPDPIWLITDSSNTGTGAVLAQGPEWNTATPIEFDSRQYNTAEKKLPHT